KKQRVIENRVGPSEVGTDADDVICNHHPLSTYAIVDRVYTDGRKYYDRADDQKRLTELAREKESLVGAESGERRGPTTTTEAAPRTPRSSTGGPSDNGDAGDAGGTGSRS